MGALIGLACALMLGALFYGAMAYQLSGEPAQRNQEPGSESGLLALPGAQLLSEQTDRPNSRAGTNGDSSLQPQSHGTSQQRIS